MRSGSLVRERSGRVFNSEQIEKGYKYKSEKIPGIFHIARRRLKFVGRGLARWERKYELISGCHSLRRTLHKSRRYLSDDYA